MIRISMPKPTIFSQQTLGVGFSFRCSNCVGRDTGCGAGEKALRVFGILGLAGAKRGGGFHWAARDAGAARAREHLESAAFQGSRPGSGPECGVACSTGRGSRRGFLRGMRGGSTCARKSANTAFTARFALGMVLGFPGYLAFLTREALIDCQLKEGDPPESLHSFFDLLNLTSEVEWRDDQGQSPVNWKRHHLRPKGLRIKPQRAERP